MLAKQQVGVFMSDEEGATRILAKRLTIIVFAGMVALLGAHELQRRQQTKHPGASASKVLALWRDDVDFTKPKLAEKVQERAALKQQHDGEAPRSTKDTLRGWANELLK